MLDNLTSYFESDQDVLGLLLFGSLSQPDFHPNTWSDIDVLVVVKDGKLDRFFPATQWITSFGNLYTYSQSAGDFSNTTRVCFENFNRVDFVFTTEGRLAEIDRWPGIPFSSGAKVMFARSQIIEKLARQTYPEKKPPLATHDQFLDLVRNFRFKSTLAVYKVVRNDLLIALHLSQDLIRDCTVLGMMLRDRAAGTNVHKEGGVWNQVVSQLEETRKPFTPVGILDSIRASNEVFETLAREWSEDYKENRHLLLGWIEKAKGEIPK